MTTTHTTPAAPAVLDSPRLRLRRWGREDIEPFAALNADPVVMEFLPSRLSRAETETMIRRIEASFERRGYGLWAVEEKERDTFVGFVGLNLATFESPFTPAVEVGWRLARSAWGRGFAAEAARVAIADGFSRLELDQIVSFTATINRRSWRVMEKLGMQRERAAFFDHPALPDGHVLKRHVLYSLRNSDPRVAAVAVR